LDPNSLHALDRVPSGVAACANLLEPHTITQSGSPFTIKNGSVFQIGTTAIETWSSICGIYVESAINCLKSESIGDSPLPSDPSARLDPKRRLYT
jgi:hypothetical protein